ncbi:MAG: rhomboid family intramembrane serine protease, partial [Planctomycetes bacterium]|nr:rhomboid family intramembrane serine protease [Planctomycetota bacterium]
GINLQTGFSHGEAWRPLTSMFLHGSLLHIALNMFALWQLCPALERTLGSARFATIYFGAGLAGSLASMAFEPASLGASGAICGIMATFIRLERVSLGSFRAVWRDPVGQQFLVWLGINLVLGFSMPRISNAAHIGGVLGGWAVGAAVMPALRGMDRGKLSSRPSWIKLAVCAVALVAFGIADARPVWSSWYVASQAAAASAKGDTRTALTLVEKARHMSIGRHAQTFFELGLAEQEADRDEVAEAMYAAADDLGFHEEPLGHNQAILIHKHGNERALLNHLRKWRDRGIELEKWQDKLTELEAREARGELGR